jgi:ribosomal protein S12 methylthiotransferase accessory factor
MPVVDSVAQYADRKAFRHATHRARAPEETFEQLLPLLGRFGITRVAGVGGLDRIGVPVVVVTRPLSRSLSVTQGKGLSPVAAKVSGIMEAIEHAHAEEVELPLRLASERSLSSSSRVLGPSRLSTKVPGYRDDFSLLWVSGRSLVDGQSVWVPYDSVHLDSRLPSPTGASCVFSSSNGLASGNTLAEATNHGLFEVIERHLTVEFYNLDVEAQEALRLDLTSVQENPATELLSRLEAAQVEASVWDISGRFGAPCFFCELVDREEDPFRGIPCARGMGCHSDRQVALLRALTEAVQSRVTLISGARDDIVTFDVAARRAAVASAHRQQRARRQRIPTRRYDQVVTHRFETFGEESAWLTRRTNEAGLGEAVVVDLSKVGLPVSVVRVIVPGARLAPPTELGGAGT